MKRIYLSLNDKEELMLETLTQKYNGKVQEYIRFLIMRAFEREVGGYKATSENRIKEPRVELTPEQTCEANGMQVIKHQGVPYCFYEGTGGELDWKWPLEDLDNGLKIFKKLYK